MIALLKVLGRQELQQQHEETAQANGFVDFGPWSNVLRGGVEAELEEVEDGEDGDDGDDTDDTVGSMSIGPLVISTFWTTDMICSDGLFKCLACLSTKSPARTVAMMVKTAAMMMASV